MSGICRNCECGVAVTALVRQIQKAQTATSRASEGAESILPGSLCYSNRLHAHTHDVVVQLELMALGLPNWRNTRITITVPTPMLSVYKTAPDIGHGLVQRFVQICARVLIGKSQQCPDCFALLPPALATVEQDAVRRCRREDAPFSRSYPSRMP